MDGDRGRKSKVAIVGDVGSGDRRLGSCCGGCGIDINSNRAAAVEMTPPPLNDISTIVEAKRPQPPIPQWQDIDTAIGAWILRQFRKFGAKRREQLEQSAKRQAYLAQSWREEMQRVSPNMLHLISGASFEKPEYWELEAIMKRYPFLRKDRTERRQLLTQFRRGWESHHITYS